MRLDGTRGPSVPAVVTTTAVSEVGAPVSEAEDMQCTEDMLSEEKESGME